MLPADLPIFTARRFLQLKAFVKNPFQIKVGHSILRAIAALHGYWGKRLTNPPNIYLLHRSLTFPRKQEKA